MVRIDPAAGERYYDEAAGCGYTSSWLVYKLVFVNSSPFRCVKNGWEVGSSLLAPSMLMDQVVLRPMHRP